jgi:hypothetical protein
MEEEMRKPRSTAALLNVLFVSTANRILGNGDENNQPMPNSRKAISSFTLRWRLLVFPVVSILLLLAWPMRILSQTLDASWSAWWQNPFLTSLGRSSDNKSVKDSDDAYVDPTGWNSVPDVGWSPERCLPEATFSTCPGFEDFCQRIDYCGIYESGHFLSAQKASSLSASNHLCGGSSDFCETVTGATGAWGSIHPPETEVDGKLRFFWTKSKNGTFTTPHWLYPEEIRSFLAGGTSEGPGGAIAFVGDSFVRQLFNRMVFWMRGVEIAIDPKMQHDAFYHYDDKKDLFHLFPDDNYRHDPVLPPLVHSAQMFFLWEPITKLVPEESQVIDLLRETGAKYLVLCSGAWPMPKGAEGYDSWALNFLDRLATELPALRYVGLVATPYPSAQKRNTLFENYALQRVGQPGPLFTFTKIGGIAKAKGSQGRIQVNRGDHHYQCMISENFEHARGTETMRSPPSGNCEDPLNLNINQLLLNKFFCCT